MSGRNKVLYIFLTIVVIVAYLQVMIVRTFAPVTVEERGIRVEFIPEGPVNFGGLAWGLLRWDVKDRLYLRVIGHVGANGKAMIRYTKDGKTTALTCQADRTGTCYQTIHMPDVPMGGEFTCSIEVEGFSFWCASAFRPKMKPIYLVYEAFMSV